MTVLEVIQRSTDFLASKGVDSPRLQAELLLAHVLQKPRMELYLCFERMISTEERDALRQLIKRRGAREPLQHLTGWISFCGLEIAVDRRVLIPRPETELLAEQGWIFLNQQLQARDGKFDSNQAGALDQEPGGRTPSAVDFGTGSGCLAIALAAKCSEARIVAVDVAPEAIEVARKNSAHNGVAERILYVQGHGLEAVPSGMRFNLIIANPPYIPTTEIDALQPEVRNHDPHCALDGGPDGLRFYRYLARASAGYLKRGGKMMLEFGDGQEKRLQALFEDENWIVEGIIPDYTQRPRLLIARKPI